MMPFSHFGFVSMSFPLHRGKAHPNYSLAHKLCVSLTWQCAAVVALVHGDGVRVRAKARSYEHVHGPAVSARGEARSGP